MKTDYYFTQYLTSSEHDIVEWEIRKECAKRGYEVMYYRPLKTGHIACQRECKIKALPWQVEQMLKDLNISPENCNKKSD